jgi:hypothetical protein
MAGPSAIHYVPDASHRPDWHWAAAPEDLRRVSIRRVWTGYRLTLRLEDGSERQFRTLGVVDGYRLGLRLRHLKARSLPDWNSQRDALHDDAVRAREAGLLPPSLTSMACDRLHSTN